jgi:hypothetical protein
MALAVLRVEVEDAAQQQVVEKILRLGHFASEVLANGGPHLSPVLPKIVRMKSIRVPESARDGVESIQPRVVKLDKALDVARELVQSCDSAE